jgi:hypothetical protein
MTIDTQFARYWAQSGQFSLYNSLRRNGKWKRRIADCIPQNPPGAVLTRKSLVTLA